MNLKTAKGGVSMTKEALDEVLSNLPVYICVTYRNLKRKIESAVIQVKFFLMASLIVNSKK